ncbi:MAG TPA: 3'-5' exonuclease [Polyangiaceae bacterium]|nr:3'-5' exonuclease [Polyangiaceae bacterium]
MRGLTDAGGCFPTGRHYPGIAHLLRLAVEGLADEWGSEVDVRDVPWVSIDTETTGRNSEQDRVIEVGCVFFRGGQVLDKKGWLINPGCPIPADASAVHGIFDQDVADCQPFEQLAEEIFGSMQGYLPLAYNAEFDRGFLLSELKRSGLAEHTDVALPPALRAKVEWIDPLDWAREIQKEHKSRALGEVSERLGIALENAHRATDDATAAGAVMVAFLKDPVVPRSYGAFIREQKRLHRMYEFERVRYR